MAGEKARGFLHTVQRFTRDHTAYLCARFLANLDQAGATVTSPAQWAMAMLTNVVTPEEQSRYATTTSRPSPSWVEFLRRYQASPGVTLSGVTEQTFKHTGDSPCDAGTTPSPVHGDPIDEAGATRDPGTRLWYFRA